MKVTDNINSYQQFFYVKYIQEQFDMMLLLIVGCHWQSYKDTARIDRISFSEIEVSAWHVMLTKWKKIRKFDVLRYSYIYRGKAWIIKLNRREKNVFAWCRHCMINVHHIHMRYKIGHCCGRKNVSESAINSCKFDIVCRERCFGIVKLTKSHFIYRNISWHIDTIQENRAKSLTIRLKRRWKNFYIFFIILTFSRVFRTIKEMVYL